jgi:hypothetical protein
MKPARLVSLIIVVGVSACSKTADAPRIELTDVGFTLHLPSAMQHALDLADPGFRTVRATSYRSDVSQAAAASGTPALFATIGDFNHDGANDVAVEGTASGETALQVLAVLSGTAPEVVQVTRFPVYDADAVGIYLTAAPAGTNGGFEVVDYPDSSVVYHYADGGFQGAKIDN